jgi:hypothetical protein
MPKMKNKPRRIRDRPEEILDKLYNDHNAELRAACKQIIRGASNGLAIYESLNEIDVAARKESIYVLPHADFLNIQGLLWMFQLELACLLDDYLKSRDERRWLYSRLLLLSLYESTKTLARIFSKGYQADLEAKLGPHRRNDIREMHGYIHWAFKDLEADYANVRNHAVGHKDPDASLRWKAISALNGLEIKDFAWEVLNWCAALAQLNQLYLSAIQDLNHPA